MMEFSFFLGCLLFFVIFLIFFGGEDILWYNNSLEFCFEEVLVLLEGLFVCKGFTLKKVRVYICVVGWSRRIFSFF